MVASEYPSTANPSMRAIILPAWVGQAAYPLVITVTATLATYALPNSAASQEPSVISYEHLLDPLLNRERRFAALLPAVADLCSNSVYSSADQDVAIATGELLEQLPDRLPLPLCTASQDGEIGLAWYRRGERIEAMIGPGKYLVWVETRDGKYFPGEEIDLAGMQSMVPFFEALARFHDNAGKSGQ